MFSNEIYQPYEFNVGRVSTAIMAFVIERLRDKIEIPFGVNVLWDPMPIPGKLPQMRYFKI